MTQTSEQNGGVAPYEFNPVVLREYDIRGLVDKNLGEQDAYALGAAFGTYVIEHSQQTGTMHVCVGWDGRESSPRFAEKLIQGLCDVGLQVDKVGLGPTPMTYFALKDRGASAAVMITGSHNPSDYNGFKMALQNGPVYGEIIQEIARIAKDGAYHVPKSKGEVRELEIMPAYVDRLLRDLNAKSDDVKVAWDNGNGAAGQALRMLVDRLPGEHHVLYEEIDGDFPNHHPDPTVDKNLVDLQKLVLEKGCDVGIAFDGDGDRIGVVDEKGQVIRCDMLLAIYAREVIESRPSATIIGDIKCSQAMFDEIKRLGGRPVIWKTGHSLIKAKMAELKAPLAGELSGHIFFADKYYGFDDALYCAVRLLNEVMEADVPLSQVLSEVPQCVNTPEHRIEVDEEIKFSSVDVLKEKAMSSLSEGAQVLDIDGVRVQTENGWWLVRASNTQNALVFRAEAPTQGQLDAIVNEASDLMRQSGIKVSL